jgi:hypothetical protein
MKKAGLSGRISGASLLGKTGPELKLCNKNFYIPVPVYPTLVIGYTGTAFHLVLVLV